MAPLTLALVLSLARDRPAFLDRVEGERAVLLQGGKTRSVPRDGIRGRPPEGAVLRAGAVESGASEAARRASRRAAGEVPWRDR